MDAHDGADIASQIPSACRDGQVLDWIQAVGVDHEVAIVLVHGWSLTAVPAVKKFWQGFSFDVVDVAHIEPGAIAGQDDRMCL
jgi:hypothetical protein